MSDHAYGALQDKIEQLESLFQKLDRAKFCARCGHSISAPVVPISDLRPSDAILTALRDMDRSVGVRFLRKQLEKNGYPMERFGRHRNYYYTLICRLVDSGKIRRTEGDEIMLTG